MKQANIKLFSIPFKKGSENYGRFCFFLKIWRLVDWNGYIYIQHEAVTLFLKNGKYGISSIKLDNELMYKMICNMYLTSVWQAIHVHVPSHCFTITTYTIQVHGYSFYIHHLKVIEDLPVARKRFQPIWIGNRWSTIKTID